jgi:hypothetical protein
MGEGRAGIALLLVCSSVTLWIDYAAICAGILEDILCQPLNNQYDEMKGQSVNGD